MILGQTEAIRVFQDVGNLPLRPPAAFAKAAATLELLSGGRFEAGLGACQPLDCPAADANAPAANDTRWDALVPEPGMSSVVHKQVDRWRRLDWREAFFG